MFEGNAAIGEVLRKSAPGSEIEFVRSLQLREIPIKPRTFGEQAENAALVENIWARLA